MSLYILNASTTCTTFCRDMAFLFLRCLMQQKEHIHHTCGQIQHPLAYKMFIQRQRERERVLSKKKRQRKRYGLENYAKHGFVSSPYTGAYGQVSYVQKLCDVSHVPMFSNYCNKYKKILPLHMHEHLIIHMHNYQLHIHQQSTNIC